ncbi:MAG: response regulator transcription factor [Saprospiraceae bacterium]|nr:response regulator transcription factor [Saprospiraceae bacterium]
MARFSCIIIEDEPLALERTRQYVEKIPNLHLVATFENSLEGLAYLKSHQVDILFLDINMDELSGVELLESARIDSEVIFTTAYQQYALKGFELNVTDYLLKPFTFQRFVQAVEKARDNLSQNPAAADFIFVKTEHRLEKIMISDILFVEGMRDYRRIHTRDKRIMTLQTFGELQQLLPEHLVCRVHKSWMVALDKIEAIEKSRIVIGDRRIPISATYRATFFMLIGRGSTGE